MLEQLITYEKLKANNLDDQVIAQIFDLEGFDTLNIYEFKEYTETNELPFIEFGNVDHPLSYGEPLTEVLDYRAINIFDPEEHKLYGTPGENRGAKQVKCGPGKKLCGTRCIKATWRCKYDETHKTVESQKFSVRETIGLSNSIPKDLRDKMVKRFPGVFKEASYEKFFWHLMYSAHTTKEGKVIIPRDVLYKFAKDRNGEKFLSEFAEAMGTTPRANKPYFQFSDYSFKYAKAREADFNIPVSIKEAFLRDLRSTVQKGERVFALGGAPYTKENIAKIRKIQKALALEVAQSLENPTQRRVALYHANQAPEDMPKYNFRAAYAMAEKLKETKGEESSKTAYRILNAIRANPVGYYRPSNVTTRMFSANHIQGLTSSVRAALIPEMAEMDLVSAHFGIIADKSGDPELLRLMNRIHELKKQDKSVWDDLAADFEANGYPWNKDVKAVIKEQFYALAYGGQNSGVTLRLMKWADDNPNLSYVGEKGFRETLFNNKYFKSLYKAGETMRKDMLSKGYGCNVYGKCFEVRNAEQSRSVMSAVVQSYESALVNEMYPDFDNGEKEEDLPYKIIYNGFDGLGVIPKKGYSLDNVKNIMNERMEKIKKRHGLPSAGLEIKMGTEVAVEDDDLDPDLLEELENYTLV